MNLDAFVLVRLDHVARFIVNASPPDAGDPRGLY